MRSRTGFILDLSRCTGCRACELACSTENRLGYGRSWRRVESFNPGLDPRAPHHFLSIGCNHCEKAPCRAGCPARAISRDDAIGMVTLDRDRCIGCGYCAWACPFEAPSFDESIGLMGKCTLCPERVSEGGRPACVEACPTDALKVGNLQAGGLTDSAPGFPQTAFDPRVRFKPLRAGDTPVESTWTLDPAVLAAFDAARRPRPLRGNLDKEWPLVLFTLAAAFLVAFQTAFTAGVVGSTAATWLVGIAAAGVSLLHLGRPGRAWRAGAGIGSSWLSREIALYGVFVGLLCLQMVVPGTREVAMAATVVGWLALIAVDRVYDPVRRPRLPRVHSADVLGMAALLTVVILGQVWLAVILGGIRLLMFGLGLRKIESSVARQSIRTVVRVTPLLLGLVLMGEGGNSWLSLVLIGLGEIADRVFFYLDLAPTTFAETIESDFLAATR